MRLSSSARANVASFCGRAVPGGAHARRPEALEELQLEHGPLLLVGELGEQAQPLLQVRGRLGVRGGGERALAGAQPVGEGVDGAPGPRQVARDALGLDRDELLEALLEDVRDRLVELLAPALQQRVVRRLLQQRVLEQVAVAAAGVVEDPRVHQAVQRGAELLLVARA